MKLTDPEYVFPEWLRAEMDRRGLSNADIVRKALANGVDISEASIGQILNRERGIGSKSAQALAYGLDLPQEQIFILGGLQTEKSKDITDEESEMLHVFRKISPVDRRILMDTGRIMDEHRTSSGEHRRGNVTKRKRSKGDAGDIP